VRLTAWVPKTMLELRSFCPSQPMRKGWNAMKQECNKAGMQ